MKGNVRPLSFPDLRYITVRVYQPNRKWIDMVEKNLFKKIADGDIPADIVYQDEICVAFRDIDPQAPTHILIIPREVIPSLNDLKEDQAGVVGHLFLVARQLAAEEGLSNGYRTVFNVGRDAGQSVDHLHLHLLGGRRLNWPPG